MIWNCLYHYLNVALVRRHIYPMYPRPWDNAMEPTGELRYWTWRENEIKTPGATSDREVTVKYIKGFPLLNNENSPILINSSLEFLSYRTAVISIEIYRW